MSINDKGRTYVKYLSFEKYVQSMNGYSETIKVTMKQTNKSNPGIGWATMDY